MRVARTSSSAYLAAATIVGMTWAFLPTWTLAQIRIPQVNENQTAGPEEYSPVYLPTDRSMTRAMGRVRERLAAGEYQQALSFLQEVFSREEDAFLERSSNSTLQPGLKTTARQLIGALPPEGHELYELLHGASARRELDTALTSRDPSRVAAVLRKFFHTWAGYEAALVLAQMEADQGHYLAAAQLYRQLIDTPRAALRFEPQLSMRAALAYSAASRPDLAIATLRSIRQKYPTASLEFPGFPKPAPQSEEELVAWLTKSAGGEVLSQPGNSNWLTSRGNPARSAETSGGRPHLRARWEARVINDPAVEARLSASRQELIQRSVVAIPAARPIAVNDVVVMRTPRNLVAIDWHTGKRIWETRDDEELDAQPTRSRFPEGIDEEAFGEQENSLAQRMWDDSLVMSLSSDGKRVFVIRGKAPIAQDDILTLQVMQGMGRNVRGLPATTNQLAAYDLETEGKLVWELDGGRMTGPLASAFFLGTPLAIDDTLYVMAEIRSAIYLLALEPATGAVQWQQQLVGLERGIALDPLRGLVTAAPSYSEGILVCPTSAGAVLGLDCTKREFLWAYRYSIHPRSPAEGRNFLQPPVQTQTVRSNDRWLESSAIIAGEVVLVTPPDSPELHCLELQSGKLLWKKPKEEALFIGCVEGGNVLLIGSKSVQAVRVSDGMPARDRNAETIPREELPAGVGYESEGKYYLPLTTGEIACIGVVDGAVERLPADKHSRLLGNLICYRGSVISQSAFVLDKFEQLQVLQQRVEAALARNASDAAALRDLGELKHAEQKTREAVQSLKRAYELTPNDPLTREMLADLLMEALSADYAAFKGDLPLLSSLVQSRDDRIQLMRIEAQGLEQLDERSDAWDAYVRLADFTAEGREYFTFESGFSVRSDRWLRGRLADLWSKVNAAERTEVEKRLTERRKSLSDSATAAELRHFLAYFGDLPGSHEVRRQLADLLISRERPLEAEPELLRLALDDDQTNKTFATQALAKLSKSDSSSDIWPDGSVIAQYVDDSSQGRNAGNPTQSERQSALRPLRIEQDFSPAIVSAEWFVTVDGSEMIGRNQLGEDISRVVVGVSNPARPYREANLQQAARLGHLLFVSVGSHILAIDERENPEGANNGVLWQTDRPTGPQNLLVANRYAAWNAQNRASRHPVYHAWSGRKRFANALGGAFSSLGPATPDGIVVQERNEIKCLDPLSGEALWMRSDLPAGCELFGDSEYVFAADVGARKAYVIRVADGHLVGERALPQFEWLTTSGPSVAQLGFRASRGGRTMLLRITDIWSQEALFDSELPIASRISVVEPDALAIYEPAGRFQLVDVRTGKLLIDEMLEAAPDLHSIQTVRSGETMFLVINRQAQLQQFHKAVGGEDHPLTSGLVYAFDLTIGKAAWPAPATVRNRGLIATQPEGVPFLIFADFKTSRDAPSGNRTQLRLLCLDKGTGRTVYRSEDLPANTPTRFRVRGERDGDPSVSIETSSGKIILSMTDGPRPPQPPANDDLESARQTAQRGLIGLGERMLRGALETPRGQDPGRGDTPQPILDDD